MFKDIKRIEQDEKVFIWTTISDVVSKLRGQREIVGLFFFLVILAAVERVRFRILQFNSSKSDGIPNISIASQRKWLVYGCMSSRIEIGAFGSQEQSNEH